MLTLNQRDCRLGEKYAGKKIADKEARSLKLDLEEIMLDDVELNCLLGEPHAHQVLYNMGRKPIEPYLKAVKALELSEAITGAHVEIYYQYGTAKVEMPKAKLSKIRLELRAGGQTAMSCTVEAVPALDHHIVDLIDRIGTGVEVMIAAVPPGLQQDLPLNSHGEGEQQEAA